VGGDNYCARGRRGLLAGVGARDHGRKRCSANVWCQLVAEVTYIYPLARRKLGSSCDNYNKLCYTPSMA
jgi:hypothetical protein